MAGSFTRCLSNEECGAGHVCSGGFCVFAPPADPSGNPIGCGEVLPVVDFPPIPDFDPTDCNNPYNFPCTPQNDPNSPWYGYDPDDPETWPWDPREPINDDTNLPPGNESNNSDQGCEGLPEPAAGGDTGLPDTGAVDAGIPELGLPGLPDFNLPNFDLPDFDLPNFTLPELNLPTFEPVGCGSAGARCADGVMVDEDGNPILGVPLVPGLDEAYFNPDVEVNPYAPPQGTTVVGDPDTYPSPWTFPFFNENDPKTWPENQFPTFDPNNPLTWPSSESPVWTDFDINDPSTYPTRGGYDLVSQINPADPSTWPLNMDNFDPGDVTTWPYNGGAIDPLDPSTFPDPNIYPNFDPADASTWPFGAGIPAIYINPTAPETWPTEEQWEDFDPEDQDTWPPGAIGTKTPGQLEEEPLPEDCGTCFVGGVQVPGDCKKKRSTCTTFCQEMYDADPTDPELQDLCVNERGFELYCFKSCDTCFDPENVYEGATQEQLDQGLGTSTRCINLIEGIERGLIAPPSEKLDESVDCRCLKDTKYAQDIPDCWACGSDGTLEPDCTSCERCAELKDFGCRCGVAVNVKQCVPYCDASGAGNAKIGLDGLREVAENKCDSICSEPENQDPCGPNGSAGFVSESGASYDSLVDVDFDPANPPCGGSGLNANCSCEVVDIREYQTREDPPRTGFKYQVLQKCYSPDSLNAECACDDPEIECNCSMDCPNCMVCNDQARCEKDTAAADCCDCSKKYIDVNIVKRTDYGERTDCDGNVLALPSTDIENHTIRLERSGGYSAPEVQQVTFELDCTSLVSESDLPLVDGGRVNYTQCFVDSGDTAQRNIFLDQLRRGKCRGVYNQTIVTTYTFSDGGTTCGS